MDRKRTRIAWIAAALIGLLAPGASAEDRVTQALVDALRANGYLTEGQHEEILALLREESASPKKPPSDLRVYWKDGVRMETADRDFQFRLGGRVQQDWAAVNASDNLVDDGSSGTEFRRVRLFVSGTLYEHFRFKAQYDFAGGDAEVKDVYVERTEIPGIGTLRIGHFKEPFSLEQLTSSKYITFQERSLADVFTPSRNAGVMIYDDALESRVTWALGAFRDADDFGEGFGDDSAYNVTGRVTGQPWVRDEGHLAHLGLSYSHHFRNDDPVRFAARPEAHLLPRFADTGMVEADDLDLVNAEGALVLGPWSLQGEYTHVFAGGTGSSSDFGGFYLQGSTFLTGEHRSYDGSKGVFGRVRPKRNFDGDGGPGAWELALRYSHLDLDDGSIEGGRLDNWTLGVNWYLNAHLRATLNYVRSNPDGRGDADIFEARFQAEF